MTTNPYHFTEHGAELGQSRRSLLLTRILWFAIGVAVSWGVWSTVSFIQRRPRDYTAAWPTELRDAASGWRNNAVGRNLGQFTVIAAAERSKASAEMYPSRPAHFPGVGFEDEDSDGRVDQVIVSDAKHRAISILFADGELKSYSYSADALSGDWVTNAIEGNDIEVGKAPARREESAEPR